MRRPPPMSVAMMSLLGLTTPLTFMACSESMYGVAGTPSTLQDLDGDGVFEGEDCDDTDATIHLGADDPVGDGIDQNCDGVDGIAGDTGSCCAGHLRCLSR